MRIKSSWSFTWKLIKEEKVSCSYMLGHRRSDSDLLPLMCGDTDTWAILCSIAHCNVDKGIEDI